MVNDKFSIIYQLITPTDGYRMTDDIIPTGSMIDHCYDCIPDNECGVHEENCHLSGHLLKILYLLSRDQPNVFGQTQKFLLKKITAVVDARIGFYHYCHTDTDCRTVFFRDFATVQNL